MLRVYSSVPNASVSGSKGFLIWPFPTTSVALCGVPLLSWHFWRGQRSTASAHVRFGWGKHLRISRCHLHWSSSLEVNTLTTATGIKLCYELFISAEHAVWTCLDGLAWTRVKPTCWSFCSIAVAKPIAASRLLSPTIHSPRWSALSSLPPCKGISALLVRTLQWIHQATGFAFEYVDHAIAICPLALSVATRPGDTRALYRAMQYWTTCTEGINHCYTQPTWTTWR